MKHKYFSRFDFKSLRFKLWLYLVCFAVLLIVVVWVSQILMLNYTYESKKAQQVSSYARSITEAYDPDEGLSESFTEDVKDIAIESGMDVIFEEASGSIHMIDQNGDNTYAMPTQQPIYSYEHERSEIKQMLQRTGNFTGYSARNIGGSNDYKILIYGTYLTGTSADSTILYLFAPLYPVASTISILKEQLFHITIFSLLLTLLIAMAISNRVTRPLRGMRKSAEKLSAGEYGVDFSGGHYSEFVELGDSLTYTSHELAKTDQLQKDLIANVSHDLRTPLTMIRSYAEMIRDLSGDIPEKRNRHLEVIVEETDRLNQLVDDMFTLSKMQAGVTPVNIEEFDISAIALEIYNSYEILCIQDGYTILYNNPPSYTVSGDSARIRQVISNLMNNAVKYCGDDKYISLNLIDEGNDIRVVVEDHGPGIPEDQIANVWDRYYRVSTNYHRSKKGTGLGLSICKEILIAHGSEYGVDSVEGRGSMFWFKLKRNR